MKMHYPASSWFLLRFPREKPLRATVSFSEWAAVHPASRASFCLFLYWGGENEALPESRQLFEAAAAQTSGLVNLVFSCQTGFSIASVRLVTKPMVIIEPAVPWKTKMAARSGILGLGSRLYPGNMQCIFNKDLTHAEPFLRTPKSSKQKKGSASRVATVQYRGRIN